MSLCFRNNWPSHICCRLSLLFFVWINLLLSCPINIFTLVIELLLCSRRLSFVCSSSPLSLSLEILEHWWLPHALTTWCMHGDWRLRIQYLIGFEFVSSKRSFQAVKKGRLVDIKTHISPSHACTRKVHFYRGTPTNASAVRKVSCIRFVSFV